MSLKILCYFVYFRFAVNVELDYCVLLYGAGHEVSAFPMLCISNLLLWINSRRYPPLRLMSLPPHWRRWHRSRGSIPMPQLPLEFFPWLRVSCVSLPDLSSRKYWSRSFSLSSSVGGRSTSPFGPALSASMAVVDLGRHTAQCGFQSILLLFLPAQMVRQLRRLEGCLYHAICF